MFDWIANCKLDSRVKIHFRNNMNKTEESITRQGYSVSYFEDTENSN